jgi:choline dehydrogenase-like flavoprotein
MSAHPAVDAIVVGSGAGGGAAAYRLALAGCSVVLLEKGGRLPVDGSTLDIQRVVHDGAFLSREEWVDGQGRPLVPEEHFNVGGKTRWYGAAVLRFAPDEFSADPGHGCSGWPIAYRDLEPYYDEAEKLLNVRTFPAEPALAAILGRVSGRPGSWHAVPLPMALSADICTNRREAAHFDGFASVSDLKADADSAMLARVATLPNLRIETGAEVAELLAGDRAGSRVAGVRLADGRRFEARTTRGTSVPISSPSKPSGCTLL